MPRPAPVVLVVMAASAVVAIAAADVGLLQSPRELDTGSAVLVRLLGIVVAVAGLAGLLAQRRRLRTRAERRHEPAVDGLLAAGTIMAVLTLLAMLAPGWRPAPESRVYTASDEVSPGGRARNPTVTRTPAPPVSGGFGMARANAGRFGKPDESSEERDESRGGGLSRSALQSLGHGILLLLLLAIVFFGAQSLRRRPGGATVAPRPIAADTAEAGLTASLDAIAYDGTDPRRQIIGAYHRLLAVLEDGGAPRQPEEAPHEHLYRVLAPLGVDDEPMHRLTELYVAAQFSERQITDEHRAAAGAALEAALANLRRPRASAPAAMAAFESVA